MDFCHIVPTPHLNLVQDRPTHLVLAHLVESDPVYRDFYKNLPNATIILDNSAFEMYKQGRPMYPAEKLIDMGHAVNADYIVMPDFPNEPSSKTIDAALHNAPLFHEAGFKTFFCPQSKIEDIDDLVSAFEWAADNPQICDYVGVSILAAPNAYGVERGNKLQRFSARLKLMYTLRDNGILAAFGYSGTKIHMLGMVDGPNEVMFMNPFRDFIDTWDSSAAAWAGFHMIPFDGSPTGLVAGKYEHEVDFNFHTSDNTLISLALHNMGYIDELCTMYLTREPLPF